MEYPKFKVCCRCFTFNQAKYITDAMNGFTMQQTSFPFICTIVDDASTSVRFRVPQLSLLSVSTLLSLLYDAVKVISVPALKPAIAISGTMVTIAGPVIVYGCGAASLYGLIYYCFL